MIRDCKICGISDQETLKYIINHPYAPRFIGFICNYKKSQRFFEKNKSKQLVSIKKRKSNFVAVLVNPDNDILEEIKNLNFDYYQLYDCSPEKIKSIKTQYKKKIITAFTIQNENDLKEIDLYQDVTDIYLFDSKGYEKSMSFKHSLIENRQFKKEIMLAGNIQFDDNFKNLKKIADIIDISGGLETFGLKDISKVDIFLNNIKNLKNED